jgi:hypothetical protein
MKITVYFENGKHAEVVAHFSSDELYNACLPILEEEAGKIGYVVTESMNEDERITDESSY